MSGWHWGTLASCMAAQAGVRLLCPPCVMNPWSQTLALRVVQGPRSPCTCRHCPAAFPAVGVADRDGAAQRELMALSTELILRWQK